MLYPIELGVLDRKYLFEWHLRVSIIRHCE